VITQLQDLKNHNLIVAKGLLFLAGAALAAVTLVVRNPEPMTAILIVTAIWCSARFYYFAFYVLEKYVDPRLRYAGLIALITRAIRGRKRDV
jgi:hypothetical protein